MKRALALVLASATVVTACGGDDAEDPAAQPAGEPRTIEVSMTDMAFTPGNLDVAAGETVRLVFRNDDAVRHEAVIGDEAEQLAHHEEMAEMAAEGMESHESMDMGSMPHDEMTELHAVVVEPGETLELTHTFETAGQTMVGCHEPGHWEAGMKMTIDV